jgi:hypothetical protein
MSSQIMRLQVVTRAGADTRCLVSAIPKPELFMIFLAEKERML